MKLLVPSVGVKEGLSCVIFRAIVARITPNLALPSLQRSVYALVHPPGLELFMKAPCLCLTFIAGLPFRLSLLHVF